MKKIIYTLLFMMFTFVLKAATPNELIEYLRIAAENNPGLKVKFNEYMAALEQVPQVGALPDPTIAFAYFIEPIETRVGPQQAKLSASQMFPWFGTLSSRKHSVESIAKAKYEVFEEAKSKLFYDVKSTYYNLYFIHRAMEVASENIDILASFEGLVNIKVESGLSSSVDAYRVQMEINDLENQLALLKDNAQLLSVKFNSFLQVDVNAQIQMVDKLSGAIFIDKQIALDSVLINNNSLGTFDYQLEGLQHRKTVAFKEGLPQFNLGFDYVFVGKGNATVSKAGQDAFIFPKVGVTIPLYRNKYKAKVQEVLYLEAAKRNEKVDKESALTVLFEGAWKDYQDALRRTELYQEQKALAEKSLAILESEYTTNHLNFEELLRMERKLLKYALEMEKATVDKEAAVAFIQYLQGK